MSRSQSNGHSGTNGEVKRTDLALVTSSTPEQRVANAREEVIRAVPEIIQAFLKQARRASVTHARFVFDFAGIAGLKPAESEKADGPSFAELVTKGLGLRPPKEK